MNKPARLYGLLARRGFDAEVCREVVRKVLGPGDADQAD